MSQTDDLSQSRTPRKRLEALSDDHAIRMIVYKYEKDPSFLEAVLSVAEAIDDKSAFNSFMHELAYPSYSYKMPDKIAILKIAKKMLPDWKSVVFCYYVGNYLPIDEGFDASEAVEEIVTSRARYNEYTGMDLIPEQYPRVAIILRYSGDPKNDFDYFLADKNNHIDTQSLEKYYREGHKFIGSKCALHPEEYFINRKVRTEINPKYTVDIAQRFDPPVDKNGEPRILHIQPDAPDEVKRKINERTLWRKLATLTPLVPTELRETLVDKMVALSFIDNATYETLFTFLDFAGGIGVDYNLFLKLINASSPDESKVDGITEKNDHLGRIVMSIAKTRGKASVRSAIIALCDLVAEGVDLKGYVELFERGEIEKVLHEVEVARVKNHATKFPEKPLDQVRQAYLTPQHPEAEIVSSELLDEALAVYEKILERGEKYVPMRDNQVRSKARYLKQIKNTPDFLPEFFAVARELYKREFGAYPYNTQILAVLLMINEKQLKDGEYKGVYSQIKTGEGKSLVFALFAAFSATCGRKIDVITSNNYLADRDAAKYRKFYDNFAVQAKSFHHSAWGHHSNNGAKADIIYTTSQSLVFQFLFSGLEGKNLFDDQRFDLVLVDEADNLCLDLLEEGCRTGETAEDHELSTHSYEELIKFADAHGMDEMSKDWRKTVKEFRSTCYSKYNYDRLSDEALGMHLYNAAHSAKLKVGRDYVIEAERIVIMDAENTGRAKRHSQWEFGLHEIVAIRNGLKPPKPMTTTAQMSHPHLLRRYKNLYCISGTFGDQLERRQIAELYGLVGFDVPTHYDTKRVDKPVHVNVWTDAFRQRVTARIKELTEAGRPVLAIMDSVVESQTIRDLLYPDSNVQLVNDVKNRGINGKHADEDEIVRNAGHSSVATISTNVAGRGTDIIPGEEARKSGGLHSLIGFYPPNLRVELQNRGRAGRQGTPGSSEIIANLDTDPFLGKLSDKLKGSLHRVVLKFGPDSQFVNDLLIFFRKSQNMIDTKLTMARFKREEAVYGVVDYYFDRIKNFYSNNNGRERRRSDDTWTNRFENLQYAVVANSLLVKPGELKDLDPTEMAMLKGVFDGCFAEHISSDTTGECAEIANEFFNEMVMKLSAANASIESVDLAAIEKAATLVKIWVDENFSRPRKLGTRPA